MRKIINPKIEACRIDHPLYGRGSGNNGAFVFKDLKLRAIISDEGDWDHVSISRFDKKAPTWDEMCLMKETFFTDEEWVLQYHPAKIDYIDHGINVLHMWRPQKSDIPKPPKYMV